VHYGRSRSRWFSRSSGPRKQLPTPGMSGVGSLLSKKSWPCCHGLCVPKSLGVSFRRFGGTLNIPRAIYPCPSPRPTLPSRCRCPRLCVPKSLGVSFRRFGGTLNIPRAIDPCRSPRPTLPSRCFCLFCHMPHYRKYIAPSDLNGCMHVNPACPCVETVPLPCMSNTVGDFY
jgi:hypothetical protein